MDLDKPKGFFIYKKLDVPARIMGLYYNSFFIFLVVSAFVFMLASSAGFKGLLFALGLILVLYFFFYIMQTKIGLKKFAKLKASYFNSIKVVRFRVPISKRKYNGI